MRGRSTITGKEEMFDWIIHTVPKDKKILDVGFGNGMIGRYLRQYAYDYIDGLDIYPDGISEECLNNVYDNIFIGDMREFDKYKSYDLVIYGDSLEHIPLEDAKPLLKQVYEQVDYIVVSIPYNAPMKSVSDNPHDEHLQENVNPGYMALHYPYLKLLWDGEMKDYGNMIGVYVWNR